MLKRIFLDDDRYKAWETENRIDKSLDNLSKINVFIGANNSGKSRFLRALFSDEKMKIELEDADFDRFHKRIETLVYDITKILDSNNLSNVGNAQFASIIRTLNGWVSKTKPINLLTTKSFNEDFNNFLTHLSNFEIATKTPKENALIINSDQSITNELQIEIQNFCETVESLIPKTINTLEVKYIPILRGLRPMQLSGEYKFDLIRDNYLFRTIGDYFRGEEGKYVEPKIFTGLGLYNDLKDMLLGKQSERNKVREFENFLSTAFFNSKPVTLTPNIKDDSVHVLIGEEERPIYHLGDGIQTLIILLYPLFFNQGKQLLAFIEEPENSLHPGLQRLFLETLMRPEFEGFQYFITTHSNHFLDITLDLPKISVYSFAKENDNKFSITNASNANNKVLDLIGVRSASVFLSNCTIWVEGITDRLYLRKYLEVYQKHLLENKTITTLYKEDFNFSFVEYGGANITHWSFAEDDDLQKIKSSRICSKIFLIADSDNAEEKTHSKKAKRLELLKKELNDNLYVIEGREIENTLSPKILIGTIKTMEGSNSEQISYVDSKIQYDKYKNKQIGTFIDAHFTGLKRKYKAKYGTIQPKLEFCKTATELITSIDDLSSEGFTIAEKIYDFIKRCN